MKPKLLDLYCGAGGAAMGYHRAGFEVVGVDIKPQKNYPFEFHQADALEYPFDGFDAIHASPPCQSYSRCKSMPWVHEQPKLIEATRTYFQNSGLPFVIENVAGAPMENYFILCGLMFGLKVFRHRLFESNFLILTPPHPTHSGKKIGENGYVCVAGNGDSGRGRIPPDHRNKSSWQRGMCIDWMTMKEMAQAIPPAYTEYIGKQLIQAIDDTT